MIITEKDVFGAMLENVEKRAVEKLYDAKTFDEVEKLIVGLPFDKESEQFNAICCAAWEAGGKSYEEENPDFVFSVGVSAACVDTEDIESYKEAWDLYFADAYQYAETLDEDEDGLGIHPADDSSLDDYYANQVDG